MDLSGYKLSLFFLAFLLLFSGVCSASQTKVKVVASIAPLADFAREVGGEKADVILLLPPGASPHTFEPSPRIVQEISKAKVFIKIGAGLEFWADRLIAAAGRGILIVDCSKGVNLIIPGQDHDHAGLQGADPHFWLDPIICIGIIRKIEEAFSSVDAVNAAYYRKNASAYISKLSALDAEISARVKTFRNREYITFHSAWNYFSKRYGLKVVAVIEESPGKEPAPKQIGRILELLRKMKTRVIFAEPQFSPKVAEAIARQAGGQVLFLDPEGGQKGRETYIELMRYNLAMIEKAMK